jgi:ATP phosphoribosyltransferase regulatory subunit
MTNNNLKGIDGIVYSLRSLFSGYGYGEYKMNKFEEYDLYVKNKDFLISDNIITFTDTNGKLLALKPDVTLSIVKNTKIEEGIKKVFYNENVYRVSSKSNGYKEIKQIGLECIGEIDDLNVAEILMLAVESLKIISKDFVLDVSPVGLISKCVEKLNVTDDVMATIYKCINEKNAHELRKALENASVKSEDVGRLLALLDVYGKIDDTLPKLKEIFSDKELIDIIEEFQATLLVLPAWVRDAINVDCSSCENVKYYNSITFKGYINNVPKEILSGGRYDGLLKRMGKNCKAIGFAIYPDEFDRLFTLKKQFDVDVVVKYSDKSNKIEVLNTVNQLVIDKKSAIAVREIPSKIKFREKIEI